MTYKSVLLMTKPVALLKHLIGAKKIALAMKMRVKYVVKREEENGVILTNHVH